MWFAAGLGARRLDDLSIGAGDLRIECHLLDCGPGGVLGLQRDVVYLELGLAPPPPGEVTAGAVVDVEVVRDALRNLAVPAALARSPLARGVGTDGLVDTEIAKVLPPDKGFGGGLSNRTATVTFSGDGARYVVGFAVS